MFGLIRRISYGVIPRPDRPWEEDPTSNAPQRRKKRRLSSTERADLDADEEAANKKKARGESGTPDVERDAAFLTPPPAAGTSASIETQEVKEVTQGVKEVDLDGKDDGPPPAEEEEQSLLAPESIPLPEEKSGELDENSSNASTPPPAQVATIADGDAQSSTSEVPSQTLEKGDKKAVASTSDQEITPPEKGTNDAPGEPIAKAIEPSVSPAGVTATQN